MQIEFGTPGGHSRWSSSIYDLMKCTLSIQYFNIKMFFCVNLSFRCWQLLIFLCTLLSNAFALLSLIRFDTIEHSENRITFQSGMFENEIGLGVLQSSVQQARVLLEYQMQEPHATDYMHVDSVCVVRNFADYMFVDYWTKAPQVQPRFRNA